MSYLEAAEGDTLDLAYNNILQDGSITVTAKIYDNGSQIGSNQTLSHVAGGFYSVQYTVPSGHSKLTVYYIPSGTDNATAIDSIKVRTLSPFAGTAIAGGGGITTDDIDEIAKRIKQVDFLKAKLPNGRTVAEELMAKSEFDPSTEVVKTDIQIPDQKDDSEVIQAVRSLDSTFSQRIIGIEKLVKSTENSKMNTTALKQIFSAVGILPGEISKVNYTIDSIANEVKIANQKIVDSFLRSDAQESKEIKNIKDSISQIIKTVSLMTTEMKNANQQVVDNIKNGDGAKMKITADIKELILKADDLQQERFQTMLLSILGILEKLYQELRTNSSNYSETNKKLDAVKNNLLSYNLNQLQNEI
jgi:hypothetical protein